LARHLKRVARVHPATKPAGMRIRGNPNYAIVFEEMKRLGYVEGINLTVDRYSAEGRLDRFPEIAREIATRPEVIIALQPSSRAPIGYDFKPRSKAKQRGINVLAFRDFQQLRGFLINKREIIKHMKRLFE
jgi:hypothetical protein